MAQVVIRIVSRPAGGAPREVRDKWIGLTLPAQEHNGPLADVMTHQRVDRSGGYAVRWEDAMHALGEKHPDARGWWETNVVPFPHLIFTKECCELVI